MSALVINLFAGPGAGKSTTAAGVFSNLKRAGVDVELVTEYAKDLTWESRNMALDNQIYILGKQYHRMFRVINQVEVAITDSPIMFGAIYCRNDYFAHFKPLLIEIHESMDSINYFIKRTKPYNPNGRSQTEEQAKDLDSMITCSLNQFRIPFTTVPGSDEGIEQITQEILTCLQDRKTQDEESTSLSVSNDSMPPSTFIDDSSMTPSQSSEKSNLEPDEK